MDPDVDEVHIWDGVQGVQRPENHQSETRPQSSSRDRRKRRSGTSKNTEEGETEEIWKIAETEASVSTETGDSVDVETELLILEYQKNVNPDIKNSTYWRSGEENIREMIGEKR